MSAAEQDQSKIGTGRATRPIQTASDQPAAFDKSPSAQRSSKWKLAEAMEINADLLRQCSLLTESVTSLQRALASANQLARHDVLTGLPNRRLLRERFNQAGALANRHHQQLALLFFDMNGFKRVNDKFGHDAGDKLLQEVGNRLSGSFRESDTVCRYGGDEFVVLLTEIDYRKQAVKALKAAREQLASPYVFDGYSIRLTVSDGLAFYPSDAQRFTDLMQLADRSMFSNKFAAPRYRSDGSPTLNFWLHGKP